MKHSIKQIITKEFKSLFVIKKTERLWHIPFLATLCTGIPLFVSLYSNNLQSGLLACLAGLVILYLPAKSSLANRMLTLLVCSFGFMISFTVGVSFSFNPLVSAVVLGFFSVAVHWLTLYFKVNLPGSFFFIFIAAMASCMPFNPQAIPEKIGLIGLGTMFACLLALCYSLLIKKTESSREIAIPIVIVRNKDADFVEAFIVGTFVCGSLIIGHLFKIQNPYWIPVSCMAVIQGANLQHIWRRTFHRILGTFIGLGLCWILLSISNTPLSICISIILLQFIVEMLIVRQYALAVIFITPMTILIAETANPIFHNSNHLIFVRFWDIVIGSGLGALCGWFIHHQKIRYLSLQRFRKLKIAIKRR